MMATKVKCFLDIFFFYLQIPLCSLEQMIRSGKIKALFLDEWQIEKEFIQAISEYLQFLWIVPDATNQMYEKQNLFDTKKVLHRPRQTSLVAFLQSM